MSLPRLEGLLETWCGQQSREDALSLVRRRLGWNEAAVSWQVQRPEKLKRLAKQQFTAKAETHFLKRKGQLEQVMYSLVRLKEPALTRELISNYLPARPASQN